MESDGFDRLRWCRDRFAAVDSFEIRTTSMFAFYLRDAFERTNELAKALILSCSMDGMGSGGSVDLI